LLRAASDAQSLYGELMEHIRKAVERAKGPLTPDGQFPDLGTERIAAGPRRPIPASTREAALNAAHLESKRIIAHDITDPRSRSFDMLRTQVLQSMDLKSWQFVGATSATEGCGKSVVSINLAFSIARQPDRSVLLVDLDLQKPQVASNLGLSCDQGILSVLQGRTALQNSVIQTRMKNQEILVLPCEAPTLNSSEWIASRPMRALLQDIKRDFAGWTVVFDLPPLLSSDDVISILPQLDCVLFIVGAGRTTLEEIKECNKHLESAEVVRVVLNKAEDATATYYSYQRFDPKLQPERKRPGRTGKPNAFSRLLKRLSQV
jgi:Mrp family chromosome partitioning ATPase